MMENVKIGYSPLTSGRDEEYLSFREKRINRDAESHAYNVYLDDLRQSKEGVDYSQEKLLAPWLTEEDSMLENTNIRFHNEMVLFTKYMFGETHQEREKIVEK